MLVGDETWPTWLVTVYALNPLVGILNAYHAVLFPDTADDVMWLSVAAVFSLLTLWFGWRMFRRLEPRVLKEL